MNKLSQETYLRDAGALLFAIFVLAVASFLIPSPAKAIVLFMMCFYALTLFILSIIAFVTEVRVDKADVEYLGVEFFEIKQPKHASPLPEDAPYLSVGRYHRNPNV